MKTFVVKEVERVADLGRVEPGFLLVKTTFSLHVKHEVTAVDKLNDEEQPAHTHTSACTHVHTRTLHSRPSDTARQTNHQVFIVSMQTSQNFLNYVIHDAS